MGWDLMNFLYELTGPYTTVTQPKNGPVEFEILLEKITIKQINSLSYTEFSGEYENDPCQVVSLGEKKL